MKQVKIVSTITFLSIFVVSAVLVWKNEAAQLSTVRCVHVAEEEGGGRQLCARLIRFGHVAFERGRYLEAKRFFQKAIVVDPSSGPAWRKYNMALIAALAEKAEMTPGFFGDTEASSSPPDATGGPSQEMADDGGCG